MTGTYIIAYATLIAHAEEIARSIRLAPHGSCIRAEADRDGRWHTIRVMTQAERSDPDNQEVIDGVAMVWDADPAINSAIVIAEIQDWAGRPIDVIARGR